MPKMAPAPSESSSPGRKSTGAAHRHVASSCLSQPDACAANDHIYCCETYTLLRLLKEGHACCQGIHGGERHSAAHPVLVHPLQCWTELVLHTQDKKCNHKSSS